MGKFWDGDEAISIEDRDGRSAVQILFSGAMWMDYVIYPISTPQLFP